MTRARPIGRRDLYPIVLLLLAACGGKDDGDPRKVAGSGGGGAAGPASVAPVALPDDAPWSDDPAGPAWDACAWLPVREKTEFLVFEPSFVRDDPSPWGLSQLWHDAVDVRRIWLRELGLPEESLGRVIAVEDPFSVCVCEWKGAPDGAAKALVAKGLTEESLADGARGFVQEAGEDPRAVLIGDRVLCRLRSRDDLTALLDVRAGRAKSMREAPGVRGACAGVPQGLPVRLAAGQALRRRRPSDPPSPLAACERLTSGLRSGGSQVMSFETAAIRDEVRLAFEGMWPRRPDAKTGDVLRMGVRDVRLRITVDAARFDDDRHNRRSAGELLRSFEHALERYKGKFGALPSAARGLAGLGDDPELLDEFMGRVPVDPWKRPYVYEPAHSKRPDGFVLRSLGRDGEIDTEDDVFPLGPSGD